MSKNMPLDIHAYLAAGAIGARLIAKYGATDDGAALATAATDALVGVTCDLPAAEAGDPVDVCRLGSTPVTYGGNVTRGDLLTANGSGQAIAITLPVAAAQVQVLGRAEVSGVSGDLGSVYVSPFVIYGGPA